MMKPFREALKKVNIKQAKPGQDFTPSSWDATPNSKKKY